MRGPTIFRLPFSPGFSLTTFHRTGLLAYSLAVLPGALHQPTTSLGVTRFVPALTPRVSAAPSLDLTLRHPPRRTLGGGVLSGGRVASMTSAVTPQQILSFWFGEGVWGSPGVCDLYVHVIHMYDMTHPYE